MKKRFLFLLLSALSISTWADDVVTVVDNIDSYSGTASFVYNKADGKTYARNNLNLYEEYGVYESVSGVSTATSNEYNTYITAPNEAYIDLGYNPKSNTRIETVIYATEGDDWKALYGTRFEANDQNGISFPGTSNYSSGNGWKHGFAFFTTNGKVNLGGETGEKSKMVFNEKIKIIQDASTGKLEIYKGASFGTLANTIQDSPLTKDCETSLYIFAINKHLPVISGYNDNPEAFGNNSDYCYNRFVKLYSMEIYEGETQKYDLVPAISGGKVGLKDNLTGTFYSSANDKSFRIHCTTYSGKMVFNTTDKHVYRYNGTSWEDLGTRSVSNEEVSGDDYKDMNNWQTNDSHKSIFEGKWTSTDNGYKIDPYVGTSGHEPLMIKINTTAGEYYNYSFKASWGAYTSWHDVEMHAYVCNFWDLGTQESGLNTNYKVLATQTFPFAGGTNQNFSLDFVADEDEQTLVFQFGDVEDGEKGYWFEFGNLSVKKYSYPVAYPDMSLLIQTIAVVKERGISVSTSDAEAAVLAHNRTQTAVSNALYNLRTSTKMCFLDKHADVFSGNTPAAGEYYLYNVGTQAFFCGGSDKGTHAAIGFPGIKVTLTAKEGDGVFTIKTDLNNGESVFLNHTGYCDTNTESEWKFVSTGDGKSYFIKRNGDEGKMLGYNATTLEGYDDGHNGPYFDNVSTFQGNTENNNNKWVLVTKAERDALMDAATTANPADVSYLITSPNFTRREDMSKWVLYAGEGTLGTQTHNGENDREPYYIYDSYNVKATSDLHQTVEGLRPGLYKVTTTAIYRKSDWATGNDNINARLYAYVGDPIENYSAEADAKAVSLPNITTGFGKAPGFDTQSALGSHKNVCQAMEMGAFEQTSIQVVVGKEGKLTFGVMKEDNNGGDCTYADNWRLTYLGGYVEMDEEQHLGYIENNINDGSKQYYDTGYKPNANTKVEVKFWANVDGGNDWQAVFSGRNDGEGQSKTGISMYVHGDKIGYFVGDLGGSGDDILDMTRGVEHTATASLGSLVLDGSTYNTNQSTWNATTNNITLFSNPTCDHSFKGRIYYCKIYEGDELLHYFLPVLKNGVPNFHCAICNADIAPHDGGTFTYGNYDIHETAYGVKLNRTLKADKWNTFCIPFAMTAEQISSQLGADAEVKELTGATKKGDNYTMTFSDAASIEAGKPYMVKVASTVSSIELNDLNGIAVNTTVAPSASVTVDGTSDVVTFHGVYTSGTAPTGSFIISNNKFYNVDSVVSLKAFRGYITIEAGGNPIKALNFDFDDDATGINMVNGEGFMVNGPVYNLSGQMVNGKSANGKLPKGIYIVNGKKVLF